MGAGIELTDFDTHAVAVRIIANLCDRSLEKRQPASMRRVPRITRAQSMDALSSQSSIAGYKAVLAAASSLGKLMPLMMTAAGAIRPSSGTALRVLIPHALLKKTSYSKSNGVTF